MILSNLCYFKSRYNYAWLASIHSALRPFLAHMFKRWGRGSSLGIVTTPWYGQKVVVQFSASSRDVSSPKRPHWIWSPPSFLFSGYACFSRVNRSEREGDLLPVSSAKVKNEWSYASAVPCACMAHLGTAYFSRMGASSAWRLGFTNTRTHKHKRQQQKYGHMKTFHEYDLTSRFLGLGRCVQWSTKFAENDV